MTYTYHDPAELSDALALLDEHGEDAHPIAGATAFTLMYRQGLLRPGHVVGLRGIAALGGITRGSDGSLLIGATATHREAERSPLVAAHSPALTRTFASVATVRVRNQATVGGNLAHADPAQDPPAMLLALDASVVAVSTHGEREIALADLFVDVFATSLEPGELITRVRVPPLAAGTRATYVKFLPRTADDYATVSVAATLRLDGDGRVADLRVVLGAAGATPIRARAVEDALRGEMPNDARIRGAAAVAREAAEPFDDVRGSAAYKREMAAVWTERALRALAENAA